MKNQIKSHCNNFLILLFCFFLFGCKKDDVAPSQITLQQGFPSTDAGILNPIAPIPLALPYSHNLFDWSKESFSFQNKYQAGVKILVEQEVTSFGNTDWEYFDGTSELSQEGSWTFQVMVPSEGNYRITATVADEEGHYFTETYKQNNTGFNSTNYPTRRYFTYQEVFSTPSTIIMNLNYLNGEVVEGKYY